VGSGIRLVDVAARAGVSRVAAGRVLLGSGAGNVRVSETAAKRIRDVARELGYQPNRSAQRLNGKGGNLLGVIINTNAPDIEVYRLVELERLAWKRGYQLAISALPPRSNAEDAVRLASSLNAQGAAGVVFLTGGVNATRVIEMEYAPVRAVYCGIPPVIGSAPGVVLDLAPGYRQAIRHFAATGRKRIGVLGVDRGAFSDVYTDYRLEAVRDEAVLQGVTIIRAAIEVEEGHITPSREKAESLVDTLLADGVDALLAYGDMTALRMIQVLQKRGLRIPGDMAVCGLNNLEVAEVSFPALTTIDERAGDVAAAMLDLIVAQLQGNETEPAQRVIQPELIIRESA
jgi:LacI family transcriptional regulator